MGNENKMKCPFRQDEGGEFGDCYGKRCMAYAEIANLNVCPAESAGNALTVCKRITQMPQQYPATIPFNFPASSPGLANCAIRRDT